MGETLKGMVGQLSTIQWSDYLDILLVAALIYFLIPLIRSVGASRILRVVVIVVVLAWLTELLNLYTMNFIFGQVLAVGLTAVVILYQPELRRVLDRLTNVKFQQIFSSQKVEAEMDGVITHTVMACEVMSREKVGALIVFARDSAMDEYIKTGTIVDAQVTEQLLRNIFFPKAALHDGAGMIVGGRLAAAGCVLPLSESNRLHADLGTRHRAGVGMSEITDAVVVIVSEETGAISVAVGGMLKRYLTPQALERILRSELCPEQEPANDNQMWVQLKQKMQAKKKEESKNDEE